MLLQHERFLKKYMKEVAVGAKRIYFIIVLLVLIMTGISAESRGAEEMKNDKPAAGRPEIAAQVRQKWLGDKMNVLSGEDPEFAAIEDRLFYGEIMDSGTLTDTQRSLVMMAGLSASQGWENLAEQAEAALRVGVSGSEIREALYQCAPYIGLPRVQKALSLIKPVFEKVNIRLPLPDAATVTEATRLQEGLSLQQKIFGKEGIDNMRKNAPDGQKPLVANYLSAWCFGDFYTRKILDLKMRELIVFSAIVALGGCDPQAKAHAQANITVGNSKQNLVDALCVLLPWIGFPRTLNGLAAVNSVSLP